MTTEVALPAPQAAAAAAAAEEAPLIKLEDDAAAAAAPEEDDDVPVDVVTTDDNDDDKMNKPDQVDNNNNNDNKTATATPTAEATATATKAHPPAPSHHQKRRNDPAKSGPRLPNWKPWADPNDHSAPTTYSSTTCAWKSSTPRKLRKKRKPTCKRKRI